MHGNDGAGARRHTALEFRRIEVVSFRANVGKNRLCSQCAYGAACGDKRRCGQEYFVACLDTTSAQGENERVGAGSDSRAVSHATEQGNFSLERRAFASEHKLLGRQHAFDGGANLCANRRILDGQIKLRNGLGRSIGLRVRAHRFIRAPFSIREREALRLCSLGGYNACRR